MPDFERNNILIEAHGGLTGGHYAGKAMMQNILCTIFLWPTLHKDSKVYFRACDACQRTGKLSQRYEMPLSPQVSLP